LFHTQHKQAHNIKDIGGRAGNYCLTHFPILHDSILILFYPDTIDHCRTDTASGRDASQSGDNYYTMRSWTVRPDLSTCPAPSCPDARAFRLPVGRSPAECHGRDGL